MNEYLKTVLEQIRCRKAWPYIRQELQDHIQDQIEENIRAGMDRESAEEAAVKDMGDPVEAGISLDRIHKPRIAWKLLAVIVLLSAAGIVMHMTITRRFDVTEASTSGKYVFHVVAGILIMTGIYLVDYTVLARFSTLIAGMLLILCTWVLLSGVSVNGMAYWMIAGRFGLSVRALMLFYVPIYGGLIYRYHGSGYGGLGKAVGWMIVPVLLVLSMKAAVTAGLLLVSMLVMLTMAVGKGWFTVSEKKSVAGLWLLFAVIPVAGFFGVYSEKVLKLYQKERVSAFFSTSGDTAYLTRTLRSLLESSRLIGSNGADVSRTLPAFNGDYILTYLSSAYGMIAAVLVCCMLTVVIVIVFRTAVKQKNQLGMLMGCGCGMVFLGSFLINVLENLGVFSPAGTFLPFLSAGGSYIAVSYGLTGIVLSIHRYKNIYPSHVKIKKRRIKMTLQL